MSESQQHIQALKDRNWRVRQEVVEVLGNLGDASAIPLLSKALNDGTISVRESAADALGKCGILALPFLKRVLHDGSWRVRLRAEQALEAMGVEEEPLSLLSS